MINGSPFNRLPKPDTFPRRPRSAFLEALGETPQGAEVNPYEDSVEGLSISGLGAWVLMFVLCGSATMLGLIGWAVVAAVRRGLGL